MNERSREESASILQQLEAARSQSTEAARKIGKGMTGNDRINFLMEKRREFEELTGGHLMQLTDAARRWYSRHVVKCLRCLETHLKDDREKFTTTKWTCKCANHI
jgi:hypothetical protein